MCSSSLSFPKKKKEHNTKGNVAAVVGNRPRLEFRLGHQRKNIVCVMLEKGSFQHDKADMKGEETIIMMCAAAAAAVACQGSVKRY